MNPLSVSRWTDDGTPVWNREPEPGEVESLARHDTVNLARNLVEVRTLAPKQTVARDRKQLEAQASFIEDRIVAIRAARHALDEQERRRLEDQEDAFKRLAKPDIEAAQERFRQMKALLAE